jgi:hypothetical protein
MGMCSSAEQAVDVDLTNSIMQHVASARSPMTLADSAASASAAGALAESSGALAGAAAGGASGALAGAAAGGASGALAGAAAGAALAGDAAGVLKPIFTMGAAHMWGLCKVNQRAGGRRSHRI